MDTLCYVTKFKKAISNGCCTGFAKSCEIIIRSSVFKMASSGSEVVKGLQSEVTCPLCLDIFTEPKRLPCEHVYCRECLHGLALSSKTPTISCPECRRTTPVPQDGATAFPTPHQVNRLVEMYRKSQEAGKPRKANRVSSVQLSCKVHHSQMLSLFCETCDSLTCRDCALMVCAQRNHVYGFISEMVEKQRRSLQESGVNLRGLHQKMRGNSFALSRAEKNLRSKKEAKLQQIQSAFDGFYEVLEREKQHVVKSVEASFQKCEELISTKKNEVSVTAKELESLIQNSAGASLQDSNLAFLTGSHKIKSIIRLAELYSLNIPKMTQMKVKLMDRVDLKTFFQDSNFTYQEGDQFECHLDSSVDLSSIPFFQSIELVLNLQCHVKKGKNVNIAAYLSCCRSGLSQEVAVKKVSSKVFLLSFFPKSRGRHELHITCNDTPVYCSPLPAFVSVHPQQISTLSVLKPKETRIEGVAGIKHHRGELFLTEPRNAILVFNASTMSKVRRISVPGVNDILVDGPHLYATDIAQRRVIKMDMDGTIVKSVGKNGHAPGEFSFPNGIRLGKDDRIYVCDGGSNHRVQVFDKEFRVAGVLGGEGDEMGYLRGPTDLDFDGDGNLYVAEQDNHRIQVLTPLGDHVRYIGEGVLSSPVSPAVHQDMVYVTNMASQHPKISVFKLTGEFVASFGEQVLQCPECIAVDDNGFVHVTDNRLRLVTF